MATENEVLNKIYGKIGFSDWIDHTLGDCPVHPDTIVVVEITPPLLKSEGSNPFSGFPSVIVKEPKPIPRAYSEIEWMVYLKDHIPY